MDGRLVKLTFTTLEVIYLGYSINDKTKKISLVRGDTLKLKVNIYLDDELYIPQQGDTVRFAMKQTYTGNRLLIIKPIPIDTLVLQLDPQDTKTFSFGRYVYDIEITFANGDVDTFISGELELTPEIV